MRKYGGRGRGRGRSLSAGNEGSGSGGASGGRGKKNIAPKSGAVEPGSSSGYTRPRTLPFLGVGKPLLKPEQQEQVLAYLADSASSSFTSSRETGKCKSSVSLVDVHGQGQVPSLSSSAKTTTEKNAAGDTTGYSMELFTHTVPGLESEAVNRPCTLQVESDMECTDAQPQPDYYAGPLTQTTTLPSQGTDPESDPDETMLPHHERYTTDLHGDINDWWWQIVSRCHLWSVAKNRTGCSPDTVIAWSRGVKKSMTFWRMIPKPRNWEGSKGEGVLLPGKKPTIKPKPKKTISESNVYENLRH
ncbi:unnamed protein product [Ranitomeya imitator]|uniref:Uncharacterized protein n=1 Tax=Ranitomeya imitator TaxID=111125 RepID=A0ABN9MEI2_9NEOB|nr:unnamed protein product [Ranitomeya imitator]